MSNSAGRPAPRRRAGHGRRPPVLLLATALAWLLAGVSGLAGARAAARPAEAAPAAEPAEPYLAEPPRLVEGAGAVLPEGTAFPAPEVTVVLELEVDETGRVAAVRVAEGAGPPFDAAAQEAARRFVFTPGVLNTGEAVPVTVTYRMRISEPPPPPPEPVRYGGLLLERGTRRPLVAVPVAAQAEGPDGEIVAEGLTDEAGRFSLSVPVPRFSLIAVPPGHERLEETVSAQPGEEREETFYLESVGEGNVIVVRGRPVRREVTKRVIPKRLVETLPGTAGDTVKVVQSLPGVSRARFDGGDLILRGANPGDSLVFLEGLEIPIIYHFGGLRSTFNSWFLDAVEFLPGNFPVDYGRATGGVIDVTVRDPSRDLFRGSVDINIYDAGFALEGPLGGGWSLGGAFHRSYIDSILPFVLPDDVPITFETAPRYYDYQLIAAWRPNEDHHLRAIWYGSMDRVIVLLEESGQGSVKVRDSVSARIMFHYLQLEYDSRIASWLRQESSFAFGLQELDFEVGPEFFFNLEAWQIAARSAWTADVTDWLDVRLGLDTVVIPTTVSLASPSTPKEGEPSVPLAVQETLATRQEVVLVRPAGFVELRFQPVEPLLVVPGVRVDWYSEIDLVTVDPRLNVRWEARPGTAFKTAVGLYQRPPDPDEFAAEVGNPELLAERSVQLSAGFEQTIREGVTIELTAFYKWLDRLVVPQRDARSDEPPYTNAGEGRIFGAELLVRASLPGTFEGWLAYTLQRSFRTDNSGRSGDEERLFDFDQPHILTAVGRVELGRGWSIGARFRLVSGNPDTPILRSVYDAATDTYVPVYGETNSVRQDLFHQLDVRIDKIWTFETWKLNLYLDVQNVYFHANQEGWNYSFDYADRTETTGIPILPILGIRGEW